jgi:hypothetical protein
MRRGRDISNAYKAGELPDYVKFQAMRQLNFELLERLKKAQSEIERLTLLLEGNGKEEVLSEGACNLEERKGEEQAVQEAQDQGKEGEEIKEERRQFGC